MSATSPRALRSSNNPACRWKLRHCRRRGRQLALAPEEKACRPWRERRMDETKDSRGSRHGQRWTRRGRDSPATRTRWPRFDRDANSLLGPLTPPRFYRTRSVHQHRPGSCLDPASSAPRPSPILARLPAISKLRGIAMQFEVVAKCHTTRARVSKMRLARTWLLLALR